LSIKESFWTLFDPNNLNLDSSPKLSIEGQILSPQKSSVHPVKLVNRHRAGKIEDDFDCRTLKQCNTKMDLVDIGD